MTFLTPISRPQPFEKGTSGSLIYKIRNVRYTRDVARESRRQRRVFVSNCYVSTYSY